mmetsp:Transcript_57587/g.137164  ORF Transcript_57587/g.137164 Transcript_57587/m.137164 type:complete len:324 (+) Transcript_57587:1369-2340(+)
MLLQEEKAGVEVGVVVLVRNAPADGAELAPLLHDTVQEGLHIDQRAPLRQVNLVQKLLRDHGAVGSVQAGFQSRGRLQGHLDGNLQQADREAEGDLAGNPQPECLVDLGGLQKNILQLAHIANTQVRVLQNHPATSNEGCIVLLASHLLLAFSHGHLVSWILLFLLRQLIDAEGRITACREQIQDWLSGQRLLVDVGDSICDGGREARVQHRFDELVAGNRGSILSHGPYHDQPQEGPQSSVHVDALVVVRNRDALRLVLVVPLPPSWLVTLHEVHHLTEEDDLVHAEGLLRQRDDVEPHLVGQPLVEGVLTLALDVQSRAGL